MNSTRSNKSLSLSNCLAAVDSGFRGPGIQPHKPHKNYAFAKELDDFNKQFKKRRIFKYFCLFGVENILKNSIFLVKCA